MTKKDAKKMIEDAERQGMPYMVFVAKDKYSVNAILHYRALCITIGCNESHVKGLGTIYDEFEEWQSANPDKVKLPD